MFKPPSAHALSTELPNNLPAFSFLILHNQHLWRAGFGCFRTEIGTVQRIESHRFGDSDAHCCDAR